MGHIRYGRLPYTKPWRKVIEAISSENASSVSASTLVAARDYIERLPDEPGLVLSYWVFSQILVSSRSASTLFSKLQELGSDLPSPALLTQTEFIVAVSRFIDKRIQSDPRATPFSEMAALALRRTLGGLFARSNLNLFETGLGGIQQALKSHASNAKFGAASKEYFADVVSRVLLYFLNKELSNHIGPDKRFSSIRAAQEFERDINAYCRETAEIVSRFAGGWYSKQNFEGGITPEKTRAFLHIAIRKIVSQISREEQLQR
jgi:hypothetical protein